MLKRNIRGVGPNKFGFTISRAKTAALFREEKV